MSGGGGSLILALFLCSVHCNTGFQSLFESEGCSGRIWPVELDMARILALASFVTSSS